MAAENIVDAQAARDIERGLDLYNRLVCAHFTEKEIFTMLACQMACAAHDSTSPLGFIEALGAAAQSIEPMVQELRQEQARKWAAQQRPKP